MPEVTETLKEALALFADFSGNKPQRDAVNKLLDTFDNELKINEYTLTPRTMKEVGVLEGLIQAHKDDLADGLDKRDEDKEAIALKELEEEDDLDVEEEDDDIEDDEDEDLLEDEDND